MMFLNIFKHLLPNARAWRITVDKTLREFFTGLSGLGSDIKEFFDLIWTDIDPQQTRQLPEWENQFGLRDTGLSEQERRDRLEATWAALGGQSPRYIQDTLQANGFDVYVHDWWSVDYYDNLFGFAEDPDAFGFGSVSDPSIGGYFYSITKQVCRIPHDAHALLVSPAYPLVNKIVSTERAYTVLAGEAVAQAGEPAAVAGNYTDYSETERRYTVPIDSTAWSYFWYVGGETFGTFASVSATRKDEFESLCLKLGPAHLWIGVFVNYV